jgi:hypothetical protein
MSRHGRGRRLPEVDPTDEPPHHRYRAAFAQAYARHAKVSAGRAAELAHGLDVTIRDGFVRVSLDYQAVEMPFDGTEDGLRQSIVLAAERLASGA